MHDFSGGIVGFMAVLNTWILYARFCDQTNESLSIKCTQLAMTKHEFRNYSKTCAAPLQSSSHANDAVASAPKSKKKQLHIDWGKLIMNSVQKRKGKSGFGLACDVLLFTIPFIFSVITACYATESTGPFNCSRSRNQKCGDCFYGPGWFFLSLGISSTVRNRSANNK